MSVQLRPATRADVDSFSGKVHSESFRGLVAEKNGEAIGIAGVMHTSPLQAFSSVKDEIRKHPRIFILAARQFRDILNSYSSPIYAMASDKEKNSTGYLEYVGFEHYKGRIYRWPIKAILEAR